MSSSIDLVIASSSSGQRSSIRLGCCTCVKTLHKDIGGSKTLQNDRGVIKTFQTDIGGRAAAVASWSFGREREQEQQRRRRQYCFGADTALANTY
jgi:hypothetical protein